MGGFKGKTSTAALVVRILAAKIGIALPADPEVNAFFPDTNSWVRLRIGDLPERLVVCTAVHQSSNTTMVISGVDNHANIPKTVFTAAVTVYNRIGVTLMFLPLLCCSRFEAT